MKVLELGKGWSVEMRCTGAGMGGGGCNALLEIVETDLLRVYGGGYTESDPYTAIKCPQCKRRTCLEDMKIKVPTSIFKNVKEKN